VILSKTTLTSIAPQCNPFYHPLRRRKKEEIFHMSFFLLRIHQNLYRLGLHSRPQELVSRGRLTARGRGMERLWEGQSKWRRRKKGEGRDGKGDGHGKM